jgi:hypothetical protein
VFIAVRFACKCSVIAKTEPLCAGLADRPAAGCVADDRGGAAYGWVRTRQDRRRGRFGGLFGRFRCAACQWRQLRQPRWLWPCRGNSRGSVVSSNGRRPGIQIKTMCLADNGILGNANAAADLGGRVPLGPEGPKLQNLIVGPHVVLPWQCFVMPPFPPSAGGAPGKGACRRPARPLRGVPAGWQVCLAVAFCPRVLRVPWLRPRGRWRAVPRPLGLTIAKSGACFLAHLTRPPLRCG